MNQSLKSRDYVRNINGASEKSCADFYDRKNELPSNIEFWTI